MIVMKNLFEKEDYSIEDIKSLIDNRIEESIHLEFKSGGALGKEPSKMKELSKDVSAFANSDGGIIIYGITEENHVASSISYLNGNHITKEWLEQLINTTIYRRIKDVKIYPIREENDISKTIYIVKIPKSLDAPHLCQDKRFYKRFNFQSVFMEEYEIRQTYSRRAKSELVLDKWTFGAKYDSKPDEYDFECAVLVHNSGDISEKDYKVNVIIQNSIPEIRFSFERHQTNMQYTRLDKNIIKISSESQSTIYSGETMAIMTFNINVPKNRCLELLKPLKMKIYLYYQNGTDTLEESFNDLELAGFLESLD